MKKAFLCYSSVDKDYVDTVARKLGRAKLLSDKISFNPGVDFRAEIQRYLDKAALFIFFASEASLRSSWCKFEVREAEMRMFGGGIEAQLTILLDLSLAISDLPQWMQFTKAISQPRPSQATRDIQGILYSLQPEVFKPPFVGRSTQVNAFVQALSIRQPCPRIFVLSGLDGIGRRTYLERACKDNLGLNLGPYFLYDETKRVEDIYLWLYNETGDLTTRHEIKEELDLFGHLSANEQVSEVVRRLRTLCSANCLPCLVDYGGMLTDNGEYTEVPAKVLDSFVRSDEEYNLAFIHQRTPFTQRLSCASFMFRQSIPPLDANESTVLLQQLLKRMMVKAERVQISELCGYLGGYPPAINLAATHSKQYGIDVLMADKSVLIDFQANRFAGLMRQLKLGDKEWFVLRYLSAELAVPFSVIVLAADISQKEAASVLRNLIEHSLVVALDDNYTLSSPIRYAVERVKGNLDSNEYKSICAKLTSEFWAGDDAAPTLEIVDATLHAAARIGSVEFSPYADLVRVSTVHRLALECYHRMDYRNALRYVERAQEMDARSQEVRELRFKTLVRLERFKDAEGELTALKNSGPRKFYYLKGFFHRMQRQFKEAVESFKAAEAAGNYSQPLLRDYAECLHRLGKDQDALEKIEVARKREPANIFILDLYIRICLASNRIEAARAALVDLERYDGDENFFTTAGRRFTLRSVTSIPLSKRRTWHLHREKSASKLSASRLTSLSNCDGMTKLYVYSKNCGRSSLPTGAMFNWGFRVS